MSCSGSANSKSEIGRELHNWLFDSLIGGKIFKSNLAERNCVGRRDSFWGTIIGNEPQVNQVKTGINNEIEHFCKG